MSRKSLKRTNDLKDIMRLNSLTYLDYLERLKRIALSMFEWVNLPESMNARYLELCLYYTGKAALLNDEQYGFINTRVTNNGYINIYGIPTQLNCFSYSYHTTRSTYMGFNEDSKNSDEAILVMNNYEMIPTATQIELYAQRLCEAQRTCDVNINALKTPILIEIDQNQKLTLKNVYEQYDGNAPVIYGNKASGLPDSIKVLKTDAPIVFDKIMEYKRDIFNEALTFLGISNLDEKKERRVVNEAESNNEVINLNLQAFLAPRKQACKEFNEKFGLTGDKAIDVKVRSDIHNIIKEAESIVNDLKDNVLEEGISDLGEGANG